MVRTPLRTGTTNVVLNDPKVKPEEIVRLHRLGREIRLTDQILSDDLDTLSIVADGPAPAWTTLEGNHISFAMDKMPFPQGKGDVARGGCWAPMLTNSVTSCLALVDVRRSCSE